MSNSSCPFTGSLVALVTPFRDGAVDHQALEALVDRQIDAGPVSYTHLTLPTICSV